MESRDGDPAAPAPPGEDATDHLAWPGKFDSPAEARWFRVAVIGRYEDFLRCSVDWLWETDADLALSYVSSPVALRLGIPAQVLIGRPLLSLGHFRRDEAGANAPQPFETRRPFRDQAFAMTGAEGHEVIYRLSGVPYYDEDHGRFAGYRGTAIAMPPTPPLKADTTEEDLAALSQALEETLLNNADLKWQLSRMENAAVPAPEITPSPPPEPVPLARTAHELRTPLNAVIGYADLGLSEVFGPLGERYLDCFRTIREAGRHMDGLIARLQDSGGPSEEAGLTAEVVDLAGVVAKAKAMIALAARKAEVDISQVGPVAEGQAVGDHRACVQILLNLLSNAVKFTPAGGSIGLETLAGPGGTLQVVVWDSGIGISPEEQEKVFESDYRAAEVRAANTIPGSGLGLSISRDLARAMGGDLTVISQPGQGSRFILSLPLASPAHSDG